MSRRSSLVGLAFAASVLGCGRSADPLAGPPNPAALYADRCASCHGAEGAGDGYGAEGMNPLPSDLRKLPPSADDATLSRIVVEGGAAVGKSSGMPGFPELGQHPDHLKALLGYLRTLGAS